MHLFSLSVGGRCEGILCFMSKCQVVGAVCRWLYMLFSLKVQYASAVRRERCAGGGVMLLCFKKRESWQGERGEAGFDRGAGLIAIMIWPIAEWS